MVSKPSKTGEMHKLTIGLYECEGCGKSYRCVEGKEKITMKSVLERNNELEEKNMEATKKRAELEEKIQALENEKACLNAEVEALRLIPALEAKASTLESAVSRLREEKEALLTRIMALTAEKTSTLKEKPLEAYITESEPEVQPSAVEVFTAESEYEIPAHQTPIGVADAAESIEVPAVAPAEPIIQEETTCECYQSETVASEIAVADTPTSESHSVTSESSALEPESIPVSEPGDINPPEESVAAESLAEAPLIEKTGETTPAPIPVDAPVAAEELTREISETQKIETAALENEPPQMVTAPEPAAPDITPSLEINLETAVEPPSLETHAEAPPIKLEAETDTAIGLPKDSPPEPTPSETIPTSENLVEQLVEIQPTSVESIKLFVEDTAPQTPQTIEEITQQAVEAVPIIEAAEMAAKQENLIAPPEAALTQEQQSTITVAETVSVLETQAKEIPSEQNNEAPKLEQKLEDKPA